MVAKICVSLLFFWKKIFPSFYELVYIDYTAVVMFHLRIIPYMNLSI